MSILPAVNPDGLIYSKPVMHEDASQWTVMCIDASIGVNLEEAGGGAP